MRYFLPFAFLSFLLSSFTHNLSYVKLFFAALLAVVVVVCMDFALAAICSLSCGLYFNFVHYSMSDPTPHSSHLRHQGSISSMCLRAAFTCADPKSAKKTVKSSSFLRFWDLGAEKLRINTLMKLTHAYCHVCQSSSNLQSFAKQTLSDCVQHFRLVFYDKNKTSCFD